MVSVYPNPTKGNIHIKFHNSQIDEMEFILFNYLGQAIKTIKVNTNHSQIDLGDLTTGIYYYHIKSKGTIISKNKIIKH